VVLFFGLLFSISPLSAATGTPTAVKGVLNLTGWNVHSSALEISGEWLFFPGQLLEPGAVPSMDLARHPLMLQTPGSFQGMVNINDKQADLAQQKKMKHGTYLLQIDGLMASDTMLALTFRADSAYRAFIFTADKAHEARPVATGGIPGTTLNEEVPQINVPLGYFTPRADKRHYLLIQVSSYHYPSSGIWVAPAIGRFDTMLHSRTTKWLSDMFLLGVMLFMTLYSLSLYWHRPEDRSSLWLAGHTATLLSRFLGVFPLFMHMYIEPSGVVYEISRKLEIGSMVPSAGFLAMFVHQSFKGGKLPRYLKAYNVFAAVLTAVVLLTPARFYARLLPVMQLAVLSMALTAVVTTISAARKGQTGARTSLAGIVLIFLTGIFDIAIGTEMVHSDLFLLPYGFCLMAFCQSQVVTVMFAQAFRTAERLTRELAAEVERQTRDIRSMLDNVPQGIFTLTTSGIIESSYSRHLEKIIETRNIAGHNVVDFIFANSNLNADQVSRVRSALSSSMGESALAYEINSAHFINEIEYTTVQKNKKIIEITWSPMLDKNDVTEKILVTMHDVTQLKSLERKNLQQQIELEYISEIMNVPADKFDQFIEMSRRFVEENQRLIDKNHTRDAEIIKILFINMHTIKGNARAYGLSRMTGVLHEVEQYYATLLHDPLLFWDRDALNKDLNRARELINTYDTINTQKMGRTKADTSKLTLERSLLEEKVKILTNLDMSGLNTHDQEQLENTWRQFMEIAFDRASELFESIIISTEKLAKDLSKEKPVVKIEDPGFRLSYAGQTLLRNTFIHIIRNALDHGIETAAERVAAGKNPTGTILINLKKDGDFLAITYQDDGRGLDIGRLREVGFARGAFKKGDNVHAKRAADLIFLAGVSTARVISDVSGRGVGMDAVKKYMEQAGGKVELILLSAKENANFYSFQLRLCIPSQYFTFTEPGHHTAASLQPRTS
jgi:signal transduction histidine kinase